MKINVTFGGKTAEETKETIKEELKKDYKELKENIKENEYFDYFKKGFCLGAGTMLGGLIVTKIFNR